MALNQDPYSTWTYIVYVFTYHIFITVFYYVVAITFVMCAGGLSVDWINNKIYFVDDRYYTRGNDYIGVLDITNSQYKRLITSAGNLQDIIVDPTTRYIFIINENQMVKTVIILFDRWLYWNDNFLNKIEKASMDGQNRTIIINTNVPLTHSLTLDYQEQRLYWIDTDYRVLECSTVNGTDRKTVYLFSQSYTFYGMSFLQDTLYFSQYGTIQRVNTSGHNFTSISVPHLCYKSYRRLKIFSKERQPQTSMLMSMYSNDTIGLLQAMMFIVCMYNNRPRSLWEQ